MRTGNKKAVSIIEYVGLLLIVITAFLVMKNYIQRGLYGAYAKTGQSFAYGRQFDPQKTIECAFDTVTNRWYDYNCAEYYKLEKGCHDTGCEESIISSLCAAGSGSYCTNLNNGTP
ncbi:MAG: hypothetical protein KGJ09_05440 [Candidatus Omnitrophica bacterium]|nr:hypothetical protein [Candidatus Omnitrophota bacterium]MDE2009507.1 hypothetical protein [Candidatus Omnitrophota bacterium]MDE2215454.1 hypothetical protein [Candidatus Omnitrophota bacterium]MDE2231628.1 hypothetical protein [Candidatus Omnitrophota bacterium]